MARTVLDHATPHLARKAEFQAALEKYEMNPAAKVLLASTPMVILNGPSGAGRNTVIRELVRTGHYHFLVSDTTRPPRSNDGVLEQNGVEYFFRSEAEMLEELRRGEFIEAELIHEQQVSGQSIRELQKAHDEDKIVLTEIEILGVLETLRLKPDAIAILLLPPSFDEWLRRVQKRSRLHTDELCRRLRTAIKILTTALEHDVFICVINDDVAKATEAIDEIARGVHHRDDEQRAKQLAKELLVATEDYLAKSEC